MPEGSSTVVEAPVLNRVVSLFIKGVLDVLRWTRIFQKVDLSLIMSNSTERLLNLPGKLPVFPTAVTDLSKVRSLIAKLHPIVCSKELIRLGPEGDGGYLVPNDLEGIEICFSPGVSDVAGFELDCAKLGMNVAMADASVKGPPVNNPRFRFTPKFIGAATEGEFLSLEDWVRIESGDSQADLLLQMDIEGYEYEALQSLPETVMSRFRILVIEFHDLERLFSEPMFQIYRQVFDKILRTHACVHIHPNNYCDSISVRGEVYLQMAELTFLRRDRIGEYSYAGKFPNPLDCDNTSKKSVTLPPAFYRVD